MNKFLDIEEEEGQVLRWFAVVYLQPIMPAQPPVAEPEEEMEAVGESHLPEVNGETEEVRVNEDEGKGGETVESMEDGDSEGSEEEEESSGKIVICRRIVG